jgi:hypothetical protein
VHFAQLINFFGDITMATKATLKAVEKQSDNIMSLKDLGYAVASNRDDLESRAKWFLTHVSGAREGKVSEEDRDQIYEGFTMRYASKVEDKHYLVTSDNVYVPATPEAEAKFTNYTKATLNLYTCLAYTQQAFGKLKSECPSLHGIYAPMRDGWSDYKKACWKALTAKAKEITEGKTKRVAQAKDFAVRITDGFDEWDKGVKSAIKRGDDTANEAQYLGAKAAFFAEWKRLSKSKK